MAYTINIFSGTAANTHMAINIYSIWLTLKRMPAFVSGFPLPSKSTPSAFEMLHAKGNRIAEQQNVMRFFVSMGRFVICAATINPHITTEARMK